MVHFHSLNEPWDTALQLVRGKRPNIDTKKLLLSFLLAIWSLKFPQRLSIIDILEPFKKISAAGLSASRHPAIPAVYRIFEGGGKIS